MPEQFFVILTFYLVGSPKRCTRCWCLLNNLFHRNVTWITTLRLIKSVFHGSWGCMKSILITSPAAISTKLSIPTHQNEFYIKVTLAEWLIFPISKRVGTFKSGMLTYDSSLLVSLWPIFEDEKDTKWWLLCVTGTVSEK